MSRLVAFAASKGGTGKTVVAFNVATLLASEGVPVVVFDLDSQRARGGRTVYDLFDVGPFRLETVRPGYPGYFDLYAAVYDPSVEVPVEGARGSFEDHDLVGNDADPSLLVAVPNEGIPVPDAFRHVLRKDAPRAFDRIGRRGESVGIIDTPPLNLESDDVLRVLSPGDVEVVPVVDPESAGQLARFGDSGLAVVNRIPPRRQAREFRRFFDDILSSHLEGFDGTVVKIPELPVVRSATMLGIPLCVRRGGRRRHMKGFLEIIESLFGGSDV